MPARNIPIMRCLAPSATCLVLGAKYALVDAPGTPARGTPAPLLRVLPFLVPRHLNRFELRFVGGLGIVVEAVELEHALAEIGEADGQGIEIREFFGQRDADVLR